MSGNELFWGDVAPYVVHRRQSHALGAQRAENIAALIRQVLNCDHVGIGLRGVNGPGPEYRSCTDFFVKFDDAWRPVSRSERGYRYSLSVSVSERGPFITSGGVAVHLQRQPWEGGILDLVPAQSDEASARAKALALKVAEAFKLNVSANWLRQFKLNPKELPFEDVLQSLDIDYSEPTALNILFNEEM